MGLDFDAILHAALALPEADRIRLVSDEWLVEIQRRSDELDAGTAEWVPWEEVQRKMREKCGF